MSTDYDPLDCQQQWQRFKRIWEDKLGAPLSFETEALLRHGFIEGFLAASMPYYKAGDADRRAHMQASMGIFETKRGTP